MKIRTMALIGGAMLALGGMGVVACSSNSNGGNPSSNGDAGNNQTGSDGSANQQNEDSGNGNQQTGDSGNNQQTGDDGGTGTADASCKSPILHPGKAGDAGADIYCPYSFNDATDAGIQYCPVGTSQCCLSGGDAGPSVCEAFNNSTYNGGLAGCGSQYEKAWQCAEPSDCTAAGPAIPNAPAGASGDPIVCCLVGGTLTNDTSTGICSGVQKSYFGGTTCQPKSACAGSIPYNDAGGTDPLYQACQQDSDCKGSPSGATQHCTGIFVTGTAIGVCQPQI